MLNSSQNKTAALSFLSELRNRNRVPEKVYDESTDGKLVYRRPTRSECSKKDKRHDTQNTVELGHLETDWRRELELEAEIKLVQNVTTSTQKIELTESPQFKQPNDNTIKKKHKRNIRQRRDSDE